MGQVVLGRNCLPPESRILCKQIFLVLLHPSGTKFQSATVYFFTTLHASIQNKDAKPVLTISPESLLGRCAIKIHIIQKSVCRLSHSTVLSNPLRSCFSSHLMAKELCYLWTCVAMLFSLLLLIMDQQSGLTPRSLFGTLPSSLPSASLDVPLPHIPHPLTTSTLYTTYSTLFYILASNLTRSRIKKHLIIKELACEANNKYVNYI